MNISTLMDLFTMLAAEKCRDEYPDFDSAEKGYDHWDEYQQALPALEKLVDELEAMGVSIVLLTQYKRNAEGFGASLYASKITDANASPALFAMREVADRMLSTGEIEHENGS